MRIVFRISKLGFGGAEQVFLTIASYFKQTYQAEIVFVVDKLDGDNIESARAAGFQVDSLNARNTKRSILAFAKYLKTHQCDLVISAYPDTNVGCLLSRKIAASKVPVLVTEHLSLYEQMKRASWLRKAKLYCFVSLMYRMADAVVCVSEGLEQEVRELLGNRVPIDVIHNPVRVFPSKLDQTTSERSTTKTLLAVGRIAAQKDYKTLLRAFSLVRQQQDSKLVIVGGVFDEAYKQSLDTLVADLELGQDVEFAGYSSAPETFYQQADLFVLSSAFEGFGNVLIEALNFGLPVVSTDCNYGPSEILKAGEFGLLSPVGNHQHLADNIIKQLQQPIANSHSRMARAKQFSVDIVAEKYWQQMTRLCHG